MKITVFLFCLTVALSCGCGGPEYAEEGEGAEALTTAGYDAAAALPEE